MHVTFVLGASYLETNNKFPRQNISKFLHIKYGSLQIILWLSLISIIRSVIASIVAVGFVSRNSDGNPICDAARRIRDTDVLVAEGLKLLRWGMDYTMLFFKIILTYSLRVTPSSWSIVLTTKHACLSVRIQSSVQDIHVLASQCHTVIFLHVFMAKGTLL